MFLFNLKRSQRRSFVARMKARPSCTSMPGTKRGMQLRIPRSSARSTIGYGKKEAPSLFSTAYLPAGAPLLQRKAYGPENVIFGQADKGLEALGGNLEMASMDIGIAVHTGATERVTLWTRNFLDTIAKTMLDKGIKPEPEIFNDGGMVEISELIRKGLLTKPYWIGLCFGLQRTSQNRMPYTPKHMMHLVDLLPEEAMFTTAGVGPDETPAAVLSILLGGARSCRF